MSRDPFDELRDRNPVSADDLPPAPMALAEKIMGRRALAAGRSLPGWAVAVTAALVVTVAGGALLWLTRPFDETGGIADGVPTTLPSPDTTLPTDTTVAVPGGLAQGSVIYLFADEPGDLMEEGGPFLIPVAAVVRVPTGDGSPEAVRLRDARAALARLLHGVEGPSLDGSGEWDRDLSTAIPEGIEVGELEVDDDGIAVVDLSAGFVEGGGSFSMLGRIAQVVYTLTEIDGIDGVSFRIEGEPTTIFGGEGVMIPDPATRAFGPFEAVLPRIMIESPAHGAAVWFGPLIARGTADVFEGTVLVSLVAEGQTLFEGFTTSTCGECRGEWEIEIPYEVYADEVGAPQMATLRVWAESAEDGRPLYTREHVILLGPTAGAEGECSGRAATTPFVEQEGLPQAVAETRRAIWEAATACDWAALERLIPDEFSFSFGHATDGRLAAAYWRDLEAAGETPMYYLAELVTTPSAVGSEGIFVWPLLALLGSDEGLDLRAIVEEVVSTKGMTEEEAARAREAIKRRLEQLARLPGWVTADGEYIGYRVGIASDGTWQYFIAGD